jgi:hypothetical protein
MAPRAYKMTVVRIPLLLVVTFLLGGCSDSDTVTSRYPLRADAEADKLFERGWLPAIIPASSRDIIVSNDLDLNLSEGEFFCSPGEVVEFVRHLQGGDVSEQGYRLYTYTDGGCTWTFVVDAGAGHCKYRMHFQKRDG